MTGGYHTSVLLQESVEGLRIDPNGVYVDATFGGGGHSIEILNRLDKGKLLGFDQDPDAKANIPDDDRFTFIPANFRHAKQFLRAEGIRKVDGILADLGVSSHHLDQPERGFSIRFDAPLDMRMDPTKSLTAAEVIDTYSEQALVDVLRKYGELKNARKVADRIVQVRFSDQIKTTGQLIEALMPVTPARKEYRFQAQVFQAIRMEVNQELQALGELLEQSRGLIKPGGRMVIITFHSLEDRLVKHFFKTGNKEGKLEKDFYGNLLRPFNPVNTKPILPSDAELERNNRSRSAKLRIAERTDLE